MTHTLELRANGMRYKIDDKNRVWRWSDVEQDFVLSTMLPADVRRHAETQPQPLSDDTVWCRFCQHFRLTARLRYGFHFPICNVCYRERTQ